MLILYLLIQEITTAMRNQARHLYDFRALRIDPAERLLLRDGQPNLVTAKAFDTTLHSSRAER